MEHLKSIQAIAHISELAAKSPELAEKVQAFATELLKAADDLGIKYCILFPETNPIAEILENQYKQDLVT